MKAKILNVALVLCSLFGYLEWGAGNSMFLFRAELEIIAKLYSEPSAVLHPFTLLPLAGQLLLVYTLFQGKVSKRLTIIGMCCIAVLFLFMFFIGLISFNLKILGSTIPFLATAVLTVLHHQKLKNPT